MAYWNHLGDIFKFCACFGSAFQDVEKPLCMLHLLLIAILCYFLLNCNPPAVDSSIIFVFIQSTSQQSIPFLSLELQASELQAAPMVCEPLRSVDFPVYAHICLLFCVHGRLFCCCPSGMWSEESVQGKPGQTDSPVSPCLQTELMSSRYGSESPR